MNKGLKQNSNFGEKEFKRLQIGQKSLKVKTSIL